MNILLLFRKFAKKHEGIFFILFACVLFTLTQWTIYTVKSLIAEVSQIDKQVLMNTEKIVQLNQNYDEYKNVILTIVPQETFNRLVTSTDHRFSVLYSEDFDIDKKMGILDGRVYTLETMFGSIVSGTTPRRK